MFIQLKTILSYYVQFILCFYDASLSHAQDIVLYVILVPQNLDVNLIWVFHLYNIRNIKKLMCIQVTTIDI